MTKRTSRSTDHRALFRRLAPGAAIASTFAAAMPAATFEIDTGNEDLVVRRDNTFRYNIGMRMQGQDH